MLAPLNLALPRARSLKLWNKASSGTRPRVRLRSAHNKSQRITGERDGPGANTHLRADLYRLHHQLHRPGGAVGVGAADRQGFRHLDHRTRLSILGLPLELSGLRAAL